MFSFTLCLRAYCTHITLNSLTPFNVYARIKHSDGCLTVYAAELGSTQWGSSTPVNQFKLVQCQYNFTAMKSNSSINNLKMQ
jgi:hypothetical protein